MRRRFCARMGLHEFEDIKVAQKVLKRKVDKAAVSGILLFEARRQRPSLQGLSRSSSLVSTRILSSKAVLTKQPNLYFFSSEFFKNPCFWCHLAAQWVAKWVLVEGLCGYWVFVG